MHQAEFSTVDFIVVGLGGEPRMVKVGVVNRSFFDVMDLRLVLGRRPTRSSVSSSRPWTAQGEALLVFAEGTRSRSRQMQRLLAGVARYLEGPETWVMPVGIAGSEALFPVGEESLKPVQVVTRIGRPIPAAVLRERDNGDCCLLMDRIGLATAELLPPGYPAPMRIT